MLFFSFRLHCHLQRILDLTSAMTSTKGNWNSMVLSLLAKNVFHFTFTSENRSDGGGGLGGVELPPICTR